MDIEYQYTELDDKYRIGSMLLSDWKDMELVNEIFEINGLPNDKQYKTFIKIVSKAADISQKEVENNFTLEMAKQTILVYSALDTLVNKIKKMNGVGKLNKIETGTVLVDRNGKEHKAHSVMFKDMKKLREILPKVDSITTITNIFNMENNEYVDDAYMALIELLKMTVDETQEEIESYLDAEFAKKAIKVCLDLPM